ncbi:hypothetical protein [Clostridium folliculivorans]|uniref:hypothetical protein n=1 Tax=Clostridium folliculivorans TaxID=2886038 RepID=UPI003CFF0A7A
MKTDGSWVFNSPHLLLSFMTSTSLSFSCFIPLGNVISFKAFSLLALDEQPIKLVKKSSEIVI